MNTGRRNTLPETLARVARSRIHDVERSGVDRFHDPEALDETAGRLAGLPADPSRPVVVLVDGEQDEPELLLAGVASGRPIVPVSAGLDPRRLAAAVGELKAAAVISTRDRRIAGIDALPGWSLEGTRAEPFDPDPGEPAIGALTSGTTGVPRAHLRGQGAMVEQARLRVRLFRIGSDDRCAIFSPPSFTGALNNFVMAIATGHRTFLGLDRRLGEERIRDVLDDVGATYTSITPSLFRHLASERRTDEGFGRLRTIQLSGEPVRAADVAIFNAVNDGMTRLIVSWGSTEAGTLTAGELESTLAERTGPLPVGEPIPGVEVAIVDDGGDPVADGILGRVVVRSGNLSVDGADGSTRTRTIRLPGRSAPERPWLDTSDAGWRESDGRIVIAGRTDLDLKINGVRVDGADLERRISGIPGVRDVIVVPVPLSDERATLGVAIAGGDDAIGLVRGELASGIAAERHALLERLDTLPRNASNKIDRSAVTDVFLTRIAEHVRADKSPREGTESLVADAWQAALGIERPGRSTTLDELGIDSLGRLRILLTLESQHELTIPESDMASARTIRDQARVVRPLDDAARASVFSIREGAGPIVAFCPGIGGHAWIFGPLANTLRADVTAIGVDWSDAETPDRLGDLAAEVVALAGGRPVVWIGYSAGAVVAWELALDMLAIGGSTPGVVLLDGDVRPSWRSRMRWLVDRFRGPSVAKAEADHVESRLSARSSRGRRLRNRIRPRRGDMPTLLIETDPRMPLRGRWARISPRCRTGLLERPHLEMLRPPIDARLVEMIDETLVAWTDARPADHPG